MRVSLEWVRDYVDLPSDIDVKSLAHELTLKTVEVEEWVDTSAALAHVVAARIVELEPVDGGARVVCDVGRPEPVTLASRAPGLRVCQVVAVAEPGARLAPSDGGPAREVTTATVLGIPSEGVVCSPRDLGLQAMFPDTRDQVLSFAPASTPPGQPVAEALGWDDVVLDIDNKSLTNRPDLWGHYGIARELAAIYGLPLKALAIAEWPDAMEGLIGAVDPEVCQRFTAVSFSLDQPGEAPLWLRSRLARIGENSRNLCVDLSNYVMFAVGQPNHVYDADNLTLPLAVTRADTAVKVDIIGGNSVELDNGTPVIADSDGPVAVAGVIGGAHSAVTASSQRFVLETASFRPRPVRQTTQQLGLRTEASARFEKGLDTDRVDQAVGLFLNLLRQVAPTAVVAGGQDLRVESTAPTRLDVTNAFLAARIGQRIKTVEARSTLESLGFAVDVDGDTLHVTAPTWRSTGDVSLPHDIVEEVARIHGYDKIPEAKLHLTANPVRSLNHRPLERVLREQLASRADMQEIVTYPWAANDLLATTGHNKADTILFDGAPAPDRNSLRPSLIPNLIEAVAANLRFRQSFSLFELGYSFTDGPRTPHHGRFEALPPHQRLLAGAIVSSDGERAFLQAKGVVDMLRKHAHLTDLRFQTTADSAAWADQSARLSLVANDRRVGTLGLLANRPRRVADIQAHVACFELDVDLLTAHASRDNHYQPVPDFPDADFDLTVVVADNVPWHDLDATTKSADRLVHSTTFIDEFRGFWVPEDHRAVTMRVTLRPSTSTLTPDQIATARQSILTALHDQHGAWLRDT